MKSTIKKPKKCISENSVHKINQLGDYEVCNEKEMDLVSDEELETVFGGNTLMRARLTFTSRCPSSIGHCC